MKIILIIGCLLFLIQCGGSSTTDRFAVSESDIQNSVFCPNESVLPVPTQDLDFKFDESLLVNFLSGDGLRGSIHGAVSINQQVVFTYRSEDANDPQAFFKSEEFSLTTFDSSIMATLDGLNRHDQIRVKGRLIPNSAPFRHILIEQIDVLSRYELAQDYNHRVDESIFDGLETVSLLANVHAVIDEGKALALEYEDMILPVLIDEQHREFTQSLFRNDKIKIDLSIQNIPGRPLHFYSDTSKASPIRLIDAMANCNGYQTTLQGQLVLFQRSPIISTDVYAVAVKDQNNLQRIYTFFPGIGFSDPNAFSALFAAISAKSELAWQENIDSAEAGRNYLINTAVNVVVQGQINVTSRSQANPQIYITDIDALTF